MRIAGLILPMALSGMLLTGIVGCVHGHDDGVAAQVDVVDAQGFHHQGYYDDHHDWHGGYYDNDHHWHDDAHDWHQ